MADAIQTLPNTQNELIIALVQKELADNTIFAADVEDVSRFAVKGVKQIDVPKLSAFTAANRTLGAKIDAVALTDAIDSIALDQNPTVKWIEDHAAIYQSTIDFRIEAALRAASAQARFLDVNILAGLISVAALSVNAATPADITKDDILDMREYLMNSNADMAKVTLAIGTDQEKAMLKIDAFTRADIYGSSNIPDGVIGKVYGIPVKISNAVASQQATMFEKSGFAYGFGRTSKLQEQSAIDYGTDAKLVVVDAQFGSGGLQLGVGTAAAGKSPLVTKLFDGV